MPRRKRAARGPSYAASGERCPACLGPLRDGRCRQCQPRGGTAPAAIKTSAADMAAAPPPTKE